MKVIQISEDNHGLIGIAKDYKSALIFLYNNGWLKGSTLEWGRLDEALGKNWFEKMLRWDIENFNDFWDGSFVLNEVEIGLISR